ncbi:MAG: helix-turn-helix domain-containing protein [bacterium]
MDDMGIGETLRNARLAKGQTTSQVAAATRIKIQVIEGLENDDFSSIPAAIYCKGFIKIYAEYLGLPSATLVEEYRILCGPPPKPTLGKDTDGVVEHPARAAEPVTAEPEKEELPKFEWSRLNIFRKFSVPTEPAHVKAMIAEEPVKFALVGVGIFVILVFLVSGLIQLVSPHEVANPVRSKVWDTSNIGKELPAPYVDSDK